MEVPGDDVVVRSVEGVLEGSPDGAPRCLNCEAELSGPFCARCGQRSGDLHVTVGEFLREALDSLFSFDSRFWRSLLPLLSRPGFLTREYWLGRRARYLPPLRLYLFVSFLTFLVSGLVSSDRLVDTSGDTESRSMVRFSYTNEDTEVTDQSDVDWDADFAEAHVAFRWLARNVLRPAIEEPERTRQLYLQRLPWAIFLLVPVFAAFLRVLFRRAERFFVPHLVFALHFHAAVFIFLLLGDLADVATRSEAGSAASALAVLVYLFLALRRVHGNGRLLTLLKQLGLLLAHSIVLVLMMLGLLGLTTMSM